jgi:hypothetical protein
MDEVGFAVVVDHHADGPCGKIDWRAFRGLDEWIGFL